MCERQDDSDYVAVVEVTEEWGVSVISVGCGCDKPSAGRWFGGSCFRERSGVSTELQPTSTA